MWFLTLRERYSLQVFEKKVLRHISEPNKDEEIEGLKIIDKMEFCVLHRSCHIVRIITSRGL
jgi:hypothetical protein